MTIDQGISLATSIGACLSACAALLAVRFSSKNSKASYKPELIVSRTIFSGKSANSIAFNWVNDDLDNADVEFHKMFFLPMRNVGMGTAKQVSVRWSFPIEEVVTTVNTLIGQSAINASLRYENEVLVMKSNTINEFASVWSKQQKSSLDFVLPASIEQEPAELKVPLAYMQLVSALVFFSAKNHASHTLPKMPTLKAELSFFDIGGSHHKRYFDIDIQVSVVDSKGEAFSGYLESRNIN